MFLGERAERKRSSHRQIGAGYEVWWRQNWVWFCLQKIILHEILHEKLLIERETWFKCL